jgi:hypothetical protein
MFDSPVPLPAFVAKETLKSMAAMPTRNESAAVILEPPDKYL